MILYDLGCPHERVCENALNFIWGGVDQPKEMVISFQSRLTKWQWKKRWLGSDNLRRKGGSIGAKGKCVGGACGFYQLY